ncbi:DUF7286 family protein [Halobacterium litoreum]|uniref:Uncharacterized protein n=1 Tax=Halobacterium litoreum TaxID=2039234 RepID=A0ABD5NGF5_9EURY|nr:hypothetical protein [Halobacterium litoreum]UHH12769.1 hypothetical protein LT972_11435 [Halobacterium litoreum]
MRLADDERARVPFALAGVVLLVASASAAAVFAARDPAPDRTRADRAVERAETGSGVALAGATRNALAAAARSPVVSPGDTEYGRAIEPDRAFRDALALRVYAGFEQSLRARDATAGGVTASLSLPRVQTTADAEAAIDSVAVERVNDSVVRATVSGVRTTVRRDGRVVSRERRNVTTTVHSTALELHDRVQRFRRLLDRDALDGPGVDRRVTAYLQLVVALRGPLQYGGAPISNVLANRHVEVATNLAVLDAQRAAFGETDAEGRDAFAEALARVGFTDVLAAAKEGASRRASAVLQSADASKAPVSVGLPSVVQAGTPGGEQSVPVGVNVTADRAFVAFADGDGERTLDGTLRDAYTTTARRVTEVERVDTTTSQSGAAPADWRLADTASTSSTRVVGETNPASVSTGVSRSLAAYGRRVVVTERTTREYANGTRERTVVETRRETYRVSVALGYELTPPPRGWGDRSEAVLDRPVGSVSDAVRERIADRTTRVLVADHGGVDALARRAVTDGVPNRERVVRPAVPEPIRERAYRAVARDRDRARNVTENVSTTELAAGHSAAESLRERVFALHAAADRYPTASARAVAAAREAYLSRVTERLADRHSDGTLADVGAQLGERGVEDADGERAGTLSGDPVRAVDGAPAYLPLGEVGPDVDAAVEERYHPLAARNVNWFTIPHGDAADAVLSEAMAEPPETVRLGRAAQALAAADGTLAETGNATLRDHRDDLLAAVERGVEDAGRAYRGVLAASPVSLSPAQREAATRAAFARWESVAARARAVTNGSAARAVAVEAARTADADAVARDRLRARLRAESPDVADRGTIRVEPDLVRDTALASRQVARTVAKESLKHAGGVAAERAARRLGASNFGAVPAGLPLAPVPGFWYATFNAWSVSVEGSWARFAVRGRGGSPVGPGDGTTYVREDAPVAFDVNGDGRPDEIGRNERLSFEVSATVAVVVPAGTRGVGDVGGDRDEQSPGW